MSRYRFTGSISLPIVTDDRACNVSPNPENAMGRYCRRQISAERILQDHRTQRDFLARRSRRGPLSVQGDQYRIPYAQACQRKYGNEETWRAAAARRLAGWGFNTLGSWSDEAVAKAGGAQLVLTPILDLAWAENNSAGSRTSQDFPDVFDADFDRHVRRRAQMLCGPRRNDPAIVGWFIDNELRWGPDWRGDEELLTIFIRLPPDCPGRVAAVNWLRERHPDFQQFNAIWRTPAASWDAFALLARAEPPYRRKPPYHQRSRGGGGRQSCRSQPRGIYRRLRRVRGAGSGALFCADVCGGQGCRPALYVVRAFRTV